MLESLMYLVIIHKGVEALDPHGVDIPVEHDPLGPRARHVGHVAHYSREQAVLPLASRRVNDP